MNDVATDMGLEKHNEDFGQTLRPLGRGAGPYLVLPSSARAACATASAWSPTRTPTPLPTCEPIALRNSLYGARPVNTRADLLDASRILEEAALDQYVFQRDAYLQRRRSLIYDGSPPRERLEEVNDARPSVD